MKETILQKIIDVARVMELPLQIKDDMIVVTTTNPEAHQYRHKKKIHQINSMLSVMGQDLWILLPECHVKKDEDEVISESKFYYNLYNLSEITETLYFKMGKYQHLILRHDSIVILDSVDPNIRENRHIKEIAQATIIPIDKEFFLGTDTIDIVRDPMGHDYYKQMFALRISLTN